MKNKKVNLNDICFFQEGPGVRKHQYCTKGVKLINVSNLVNGEIDLSNSNRYISQEEAYGRYKHFLIDEGDLIIASSGIKVEYLDKKIAFIKKENLPLCMNTSTIRFKVKNKNELDILYLSYFLKSKNFKNQISKLITGSAQLNFGGSHLKKINLFLPKLNVQKKVSTLLLLIDNTIKDMQRKLSILEQLTKSLFATMFGNIKTNDKNWKIYYWKDVLNIKNGKNQKQVEDINGKYPIYGSGGIIGRSNAYICNENSIIIGRKGNINKPILVKEKFWNVDTAFGLEVKSEKMSYHYLYYFCLFYDFEIHNKAVTIPSLVKSDLEKIILPVPPIELQNKFAERIEKIEKLKFIISAIILNPYELLKKKGVEKI